MALQHLRTSTAHKRPIPSVMSAGQLAVNINEASPGLFFKDSNGDLVKVGPVHIGTDAPNSSPASVAATALVTGTVYQILTVGTSDFTLVGASANTVGAIFTATGTTTGDGTVSGQQGVEKGEMWLDTTGGTYVLKIYDGTAWRSESGTFVDVNGDTMTGSLILPSGTAAAPALGVGSTDNGLYSPGTDQVAVSTNGTGRLFIDNSGKVGIGITSPNETLSVEVNGTTNRAIEIYNNDTTLSAGELVHAIRFTQNDTSYPNTTHASIETVTTGSTGFLNMVFKARDNTEYMRIDTTGNVGIGTSSPDAPLHVQNNDNAPGGYIQRWSADLGVNNRNANLLAPEVDDTNSPFTFFTNSSWNFRVDTTDALTIDTIGKVGIGVTAPTQKLDLTDSSGARIAFTNSGSRRWSVGNNGTSLTIRDESGSTDRLAIDNSGKIGIGTSSPAQLLHMSGVNPRLRITDTDTTAATSTSYLEFYGSDSRSAVIFTDSSGLNIQTDSAAPGPICFKTSGGNERARIEDSGARLILGNTTSNTSVAYSLVTSGRIQSNASYSNTTASAANVNITSTGLLVRSTSSARYKTNVETLEDSYADAVLNARPVYFNSIASDDTAHPEWSYWGFIAEEVAEIDPRLVHYSEDDDGNLQAESVQYDRFVPHLINLVKRQRDQIEAMEARLSALEAQ